MNAKQLYELKRAELDYKLFSKNNITVLFDTKVMRFRLFNSQPTSISNSFFFTITKTMIDNVYHCY